MDAILQVVTTTGSREEAERIAGQLVERRLAACVQISGPITSTYRWQGKLETGQEWLCLIKTLREQFAAIEAAIRELHSYEVPEILAFEATTASEAYHRWLAAEVTP
jgi:periplasmic divalent cation tolerance protein